MWYNKMILMKMIMIIMILIILMIIILMWNINDIINESNNINEK